MNLQYPSGRVERWNDGNVDGKTKATVQVEAGVDGSVTAQRTAKTGVTRTAAVSTHSKHMLTNSITKYSEWCDLVHNNTECESLASCLSAQREGNWPSFHMKCYCEPSHTTNLYLVFISYRPLGLTIITYFMW